MAAQIHPTFDEFKKLAKKGNLIPVFADVLADTVTPVSLLAMLQPAPADASGGFTIANVAPGRYLVGDSLYLGANAGSLTWSLQSVVVDGRDMTDLPIDVTYDAPPKNIVVTYGDRSQEVAGALSQQAGTPADYTVVVFPADKAYWIQGTRRIAITRPDTTGHFVLGGPGPSSLPPGRYLIAAVNDIDKDEQFDPAFLAVLVPSALPVTVQPGEKKTQNLTIK